MRKNPLIQIVTLTKYKGPIDFFSTLKVVHVPISQIQQETHVTDNDCDLTVNIPFDDENQEKINDDSVSYTTVKLQIDNNTINLRICNPSIPLSYSIKKFAQELYLTDALIVDMQCVKTTRTITSLEVINFIKKLRKLEPLLPISLIINTDANKNFLHDLSFGIEHSNVSILYKKPDECIYPVALESTVLLSSRPRGKILEFYKELRIKRDIPYNAKLADIIKKAQDGKHPNYTRIAKEQNLLTSLGTITYTTKKFLEDEQCYVNRINENDSLTNSASNHIKQMNT